MQFARVTVKFWCEFYWISSKISTHLEWLEAAGAVCWLGPGEGWCGDDAAPLQPRPRGHPGLGQQQGRQQQVQGGQGQHVSREGRGEQLHCIYPLALCLVVGYHLGFLLVNITQVRQMVTLSSSAARHRLTLFGSFYSFCLFWLSHSNIN